MTAFVPLFHLLFNENLGDVRNPQNIVLLSSLDRGHGHIPQTEILEPRERSQRGKSEQKKS